MTRINLVDPSTLHSKHLLAEYRALPRVFKLVLAAQQRGLTPDTAHIPLQYVLGPGHVTFFYNKLTFLERRFFELVTECLNRGFKVQYQGIPDMHLDHHWCGDYTPTPQAIELNAARIKDRMPK